MVEASGYSESYIELIANQNGLGVDHPSKKSTSINTLKIIAELQNTDKSLREIAKRFFLSHQRVGEILRKSRSAGIKFPNRDKEDPGAEDRKEKS